MADLCAFRNPLVKVGMKHEPCEKEARGHEGEDTHLCYAHAKLRRRLRELKESAPHTARRFDLDSFAATDEYATAAASALVRTLCRDDQWVDYDPDHDSWKLGHIENVGDRSFIPTARNVILHGARGTGKSTLAFALERHWLLMFEGDYSVEWISLPKMIAAEKRSWNGGPEFEAPNIEANILVIDDLGTENTKYSLQKAREIIDLRYEDGDCTTIVTTNYAPAALGRRLGYGAEPIEGERLVSRLCQDAVILEMDGPDRRVATARVVGASRV